MVLNFLTLANLGHLSVDSNYFKTCYVSCFTIANLLFHSYLTAKSYVLVLVGAKPCQGEATTIRTCNAVS